MMSLHPPVVSSTVQNPMIPVDMVATISEVVQLRTENTRLRIALEEALTRVQMHQSAMAAAATAAMTAAAQQAAVQHHHHHQHAALSTPEMLTTPPSLITDGISRVHKEHLRPPPLTDYGAQAADDAAAALSALKRSCGPIPEDSAERKRSKWTAGEWGSAIISPPAYNGDSMREETPTSNEPAVGLPNRRLSSSSAHSSSSSQKGGGRSVSVSSAIESSLDALADGSDAWKHTRGRKSSLIWTESQDVLLIEAVKHHKGKNWKAVAEMIGLDRTNIQCKHRWQKVLDPNLVKGPWSPDEDRKIAALVTEHGAKRWSFIAKHLQGRTGKQCRERWVNQLDPTIKKDPWSAEEDAVLQDAHERLGNKWAEIAKRLVGRSENAVKNRWHGSLRRNMVYLANKAAATTAAAAAASRAMNSIAAAAPMQAPITVVAPPLVAALPAPTTAPAPPPAPVDADKVDLLGCNWLFSKSTGETQDLSTPVHILANNMVA